MQFMIDTDTETSAGLLLAVEMLQKFAALKGAEESSFVKVSDHVHVQPGPIYTHTVAPGHVVAPDGTVKVGSAVEPEAPTEPAPISNADATAAQVFGKSSVPAGTNVVPLFPTLPPVNAQPVAQTPVNTAAPVTPAAPAVATPAAGAQNAASVEVDAQGIPWDARIHQKSKGKKKTDGTWKLIKGLDPAIAQAVTAELLAKKNAVATNAPLVAALNAPVTLPPVAPPATLPVLPNTGGTAPLPTTAPLPVQGQPATGASPLEAFRDMMVKIGEAQKANIINQAQVNEAHVAEGLAQLSLAITQPDKIPAIMARLGL